MAMSADVFISYTSRDRAVALAINDRLRRAGVSVWIDRTGIEGAQQWSQAIVEAADEARVLLLLLSRAAIASPNVMKEVSLFAEKRKEILPVFLEAAELSSGLRYHLSGVQHLEWGPQEPEASYQRIFSALRRLGISVPEEAVLAAGALPATPGGHYLPDSRHRKSRGALWAVVLACVGFLLLGVLGIALWFHWPPDKRSAHGATGKGPGERSEGVPSRLLLPAALLRTMRDHLQSLPESDRPLQRFLTLRCVQDHPGVTAEQFQQFREELNRLTGKQAHQVLRPLGPEGTLFALDLRDWTEEPGRFWAVLTQRYPYALLESECPDAEVHDLAREVEALSGCDLCHVRADWFAAAVAQLQARNAELFIGPIAEQCRLLLRHHAQPLGPAEAAAELGLNSADELGNLLRAAPGPAQARLRQLGVWPLAEGGHIPRDLWRKATGSLSPFQQLAVELDLGCPVRPALTPPPETLHGRSLKAEMDQLAASVGGFLRCFEQTTLTLENWQGPPGLSATGWPRLVHLLQRALEEQGVRCQANASFRLRGRFAPSARLMTGRAGVRLRLQAADSTTGRVVACWVREMEGLEGFSPVFGPTVQFDPDEDGKRRAEHLLTAIAHPEAAVQSGAAAAAATSPYSIQILVKRQGGQEPLETTMRDGMAWVKLAAGDIYEVKLSNRSEFDAAVELTIDGLNLFAFGEGRREGRVLVRARDAVVVKGWYRTAEVSNEFKVTQYADSPAARLLPPPEAVGTVTASFAAAWPKDRPPPPDEPDRGDRGEAGAEGLATTAGDAVKQHYAEAERLVGEVRAIVSIRYSRPPPTP
jgi:hypothetical protein